MKRIFLSLLLLFSFSNANTITIAVAANVSYAIEDLKKEFHLLHPNITVRVILGSSGKLTAQIKNGAPYGIFLSANMKYPYALFRDKLALSKPIIYAKGTLSYLSTKERDFSQGIQLLQQIDIHRIAIANPKTAPYGLATVIALKNAKIYDAIHLKLVYGESISQTLSYTMRATDIGIVATSLLYSKQMRQFKKGKNWIQLEAKLYTPIEQGVVLLKYSKSSEDYKAFYRFLLTKKAKEIFKAYGYLTS